MRQKRFYSMSNPLPTLARHLAGLVLGLAGLVLALSFVSRFVDVGIWDTIEVAITFAIALAAAVSILAGIVLLGVARREQRLNRSDTAVVVLAGTIVAAVALLSVRNFLVHASESGPIAAMESDLRGLWRAESVYFASHQSFTDDLAALDFQSESSVQVVVEMADGIGWRATASSEYSRYTCTLSFQGDAEEARHGGPTCTK